MADVQRTRAAILAILADNPTGNISEQDLRDFAVTIMETEFENPGDFWKKPEVRRMTSDKTVKAVMVLLIEAAWSRRFWSFRPPKPSLHSKSLSMLITAMLTP